MRNLSENSSTAWLVFGMFLVYMPIGMVQQSLEENFNGDLFGFMTELNFFDWVWVGIFGLVSVLNMTTRAIAI